MGFIYQHPDDPQTQVEPILVSAIDGEPDRAKLWTVRLRYPRILHGEVMTHRVFGRNARSSRAVPVRTMLNEVLEKPFIPRHWGKNQKGMQSGEECDEFVDIQLGAYTNRHAWLVARDRAAEVAEGYMDAGYHKQIPNRLLEPFSYIDTLITANHWSNFRWLRDEADAEPHLQDLAGLVRDMMDDTEGLFGSKEEQRIPFQTLAYGEWHLPYITDEDWYFAQNFARKGRVTRDIPQRSEIIEILRKISAARCARISYKPFDGDSSYERELDRYDMLVNSKRVHASPLEHQATPDARREVYICPQAPDGTVDHGNAELTEEWGHPHLHGNLTGWVQGRKLVPNEAVMEAA